MKKIILILVFLISLFNNSIARESNLQLKIYKNLRCLVCQGQSIAGSNSDFAQTIKLVVEASGAVENLTMLEAIDFGKATAKASKIGYKAPGQ